MSSPRLPKTLYHYTSQYGFFSIIQSKSLWASKIQFLNDQREFSYGFQLARTVMSEIQAAETNEDRKKIYDELIEALNGYKGVHIFVACFSEKKDSLSQWRSYCPAGAGYSIGFSSKQLTKINVSKKYTLVKCIYDVRKQKSMLHEFIIQFLLSHADKISEILSKKRSVREEFDLVRALSEGFMNLAPALKDPSFKEEAEWRLVSQPTSYLDHNFQFRPGNFSIIPYFIIQFGDKASQIPITEVVLGPNPHSQTALEALEWFLRKNDLQNVARHASKVPYRQI